ncbi:MAG: hypothetical protein EOO12_11745 [Chitinophagaceae bacterium]|nr:MAG: hypothetical protein EOO12_11745 [Chitinophagaceae bacterium]
MRLPKLLLPILCFLTVAASAQDCAPVREGKYRVPADDYNPNASFLTRTDKYQYEDVPSIGFRMRCAIRWTSPGDSPQWPKDLVIYVTIKEVRAKSYVAVVHSNYSEQKLEKEIFFEAVR